MQVHSKISPQGSDSIFQKVVYFLHSIFVSRRRTKKLTSVITELLPHDVRLIGIDVGCGTGSITSAIQKKIPTINIIGLDVVKRNNAAINIIEYDGRRIPFPNNSYDFCMLIDVLHHTHDPASVLMECIRVSRKFIIIVDHICNSVWNRRILSLMDWVGNLGYEASLPGNYLSEREWDELFHSVNLLQEKRINRLCLYPVLFNHFFDNKLHFAVRLKVVKNV